MLEASLERESVFDKLDRIIAGIREAETIGQMAMHSVAALSLLQSAARVEDPANVAQYLDQYTHAMNESPAWNAEQTQLI